MCFSSYVLCTNYTSGKTCTLFWSWWNYNSYAMLSIIRKRNIWNGKVSRNLWNSGGYKINVKWLKQMFFNIDVPYITHKSRCSLEDKQPCDWHSFLNDIRDLLSRENVLNIQFVGILGGRQWKYFTIKPFTIRSWNVYLPTEI